MTFKFPLNSADDETLKQVTAAVFDTGGNEFDAAAAFMTLRIKSELEAELVVGRSPGLVNVATELPKLSVGISRTGNFMRYFRAHGYAFRNKQAERATGSQGRRDDEIANAGWIDQIRLPTLSNPLGLDPLPERTASLRARRG